MIPDPRDQPTMNAESVFAAFVVDRTTGYRQVAHGTFPVEPIRCGRLLRFSTARVRAVLGLPDTNPAGDDPAALVSLVEAYPAAGLVE